MGSRSDEIAAYVGKWGWSRSVPPPFTTYIILFKRLQRWCSAIHDDSAIPAPAPALVPATAEQPSILAQLLDRISSLEKRVAVKGELTDPMSISVTPWAARKYCGRKLYWPVWPVKNRRKKRLQYPRIKPHNWKMNEVTWFSRQYKQSRHSQSMNGPPLSMF